MFACSLGVNLYLIKLLVFLFFFNLCDNIKKKLFSFNNFSKITLNIKTKFLIPSQKVSQFSFNFKFLDFLIMLQNFDKFTVMVSSAFNENLFILVKLNSYVKLYGYSIFQLEKKWLKKLNNVFKIFNVFISYQMLLFV